MYCASLAIIFFGDDGSGTLFGPLVRVLPIRSNIDYPLSTGVPQRHLLLRQPVRFPQRVNHVLRYVATLGATARSDNIWTLKTMPHHGQGNAIFYEAFQKPSLALRSLMYAIRL